MTKAISFFCYIRLGRNLKSWRSTACWLSTSWKLSLSHRTPPPPPGKKINNGKHTLGTTLGTSPRCQLISSGQRRPGTIVWSGSRWRIRTGGGNIHTGQIRRKKVLNWRHSRLLLRRKFPFWLNFSRKTLLILMYLFRRKNMLLNIRPLESGNLPKSVVLFS